MVHVHHSFLISTSLMLRLGDIYVNINNKC
ncbi:hypothetical protein JDXMQMMX_CDS2 [Acinetobacter phage vB_AbaM_AB4P2]|nr:hypothetical protein JDXMQMMX_CDS2 [Acinetobacter phage vB_AbaM_AB4P2]